MSCAGAEGTTAFSTAGAEGTTPCISKTPDPLRELRFTGAGPGIPWNENNGSSEENQNSFFLPETSSLAPPLEPSLSPQLENNIPRQQHPLSQHPPPNTDTNILSQQNPLSTTSSLKTISSLQPNTLSHNDILDAVVPSAPAQLSLPCVGIVSCAGAEGTTGSPYARQNPAINHTNL